MSTQLRQYWPHMRLADKTLIIILGVIALIYVALLISEPSLEALGGALGSIAFCLLVILLNIRAAENHLLRLTVNSLLDTIGTLLERNGPHPENQ